MFSFMRFLMVYNLMQHTQRNAQSQHVQYVFWPVLKQLPEAHVEKPQATCEDGREQQESLGCSWKGIILGRDAGEAAVVQQGCYFQQKNPIRTHQGLMLWRLVARLFGSFPRLLGLPKIYTFDQQICSKLPFS